jgi:hypothetical protein
MNNVVLQDLLLRLLEGGYRSKDKELRNAICILLSFASRQESLPMPLSRHHSTGPFSFSNWNAYTRFIPLLGHCDQRTAFSLLLGRWWYRCPPTHAFFRSTGLLNLLIAYGTVAEVSDAFALA